MSDLPIEAYEVFPGFWELIERFHSIIPFISFSNSSSGLATSALSLLSFSLKSLLAKWLADDARCDGSVFNLVELLVRMTHRFLPSRLKAMSTSAFLSHGATLRRARPRASVLFGHRGDLRT